MRCKESGKGNDSGNREGKGGRTEQSTMSHFQLPQRYPEISSLTHPTECLPHTACQATSLPYESNSSSPQKETAQEYPAQ